MGKNILVAVGGGGQDVAIAYLRMLALSGGAKRRLPDIYVVDADTHPIVTKDGKSGISRFKELEKLHGDLTKIWGGDDKPRLTQLSPYPPDPNRAGDIDSKKTFGQHFSAVALSEEKKKDAQMLMDACFSRAEQATELHNGMFRRPNIGATAVYGTLAFADSDALRQLTSDAKNRDAQIAVIGSSFGGTGSGGVPAIALELSNRQQHSKVCAFFTLSWFDLDGVTPELSNDFDCNTASGLRFYAETAGFEGFACSLSAFPWKARRSYQGDDRQEEERHAFNLILSAAVRRFFRGEFAADKGKLITFSLPAGAQTIDAKTSPLTNFDVHGSWEDASKAGKMEELHDLAMMTQSYRLALRGLASYVENQYRVPWEKAGRHLEKESKTPMEEHPLTLLLHKAQKAAGHETKAEGPLDKMKNAINSQFGRCGIDPEFRKNFCGEGGLRKLDSEAKEVLGWLHDVKARSTEASGQERLSIADICFREDVESIWDQLPAVRQGLQEAKFDKDQDMYRAAFALYGGATLAYDMVSKFDGLKSYSAGTPKKEDQPPSPHESAARLVAEHLWHRVVNLHQKTEGDLPKNETGERKPVFLPLTLDNTKAAGADWPILSSSNLLEANPSTLPGGDGGVITPVSSRHPCSFRKLRARGVPSPWAAAHAEAWRQVAVNVGIESKEEDGFDGVGPDSLRGKARERLEAVLWGIFTKKLTLTPINLDQIGGHLAKALLGTLRKELGVTAAGDLPKEEKTIRLAVRAADGLIVAANHPKCGWYPVPTLGKEDYLGITRAWWKEQEGEWELHDVHGNRQLPSEFDVGSEHPVSLAIRLGQAEIGVRFSSAYRLRQLKAFCAWLEELRTSAGAHQHIGWWKAIDSLATSLRVKFPRGDGTSEDTSLEELDKTKQEHFLVLLNGENGKKKNIRPMPVWHWKETIEEKKKELEQLVKRIFVAELLVPTGQNEPEYPDSPLTFKAISNGERATSAKAKVVEVPNWSSLDSKKGFSDWKIQWGDYELSARIPYRMETLPLSSVLWPNFAAKEWKLYLLGSSIGITDSTRPVLDIKFVFYDKEAKPIEAVSGHDRTARFEELEIYRNHELDGRPRWVELVRNGKGLGMHLIDLGTDLETDGAPCNVAFDFGTSHSCALVMSNDKLISLRLGRDEFRQNCKPLFDLSKLEEDLTGKPNFLPTVTGKQQSAVLPTELNYFYRSDDGQLNGSRKTNLQTKGIAACASLPMQFRTPEIRADMFTEVAGDFKGPGFNRIPEKFREADHELRENYIRQYLMMLFAELRTYQGQAFGKISSFHVTYPLAFQPNYRDGYVELVSRIIADLTEKTGITYSMNGDKGTDKKPCSRVSESVAALHAVYPTPGKGFYLVLDMGGGTTDVAAVVVGDDASKPEAVLVDSLRYAGHDVLDMLRTDNALMDSLYPPDPNPAKANEAITVRPELLKNWIRDAGKFDEIVRALGRKEKGGWKYDTVRGRIEGFFTGICVYAIRLAQAFKNAHPGIDTMNVVLLGNGWGLAKLIYGDNPDKAIAEVLVSEATSAGVGIKIGCRMGRNMQEAKIHKADDKTLIALGALNHAKAGIGESFSRAVDDYIEKTPLILSGIPVRYPHANGAVSYGPCELIRAEKLMSGEVCVIATDLPGLDLPSSMASRVERYIRDIYHGDAGSFLIQPINVAMAGRENRESAQLVDPSPLGKFLETVWIKALSS